MTTLKYPRIWASDTNYSSGSANGTPTKQDVGAALAAQGMLPGRASAQAFNNEMSAYSIATRYAVENFLRAWAPITLDDAPPNTNGIAAFYDSVTGLTVLAKGGTNGNHWFGDELRADTQANPGTVTTARSMAYDPVAGRLVVVGTGGGFAAHSTNLGSSWTDAATPPAAFEHVTWDAVNSLFISTGSGIAAAWTSPTGVTWTVRALTATNQGLHATLPSGLSCSSNETNASLAFKVSSNGTSWTASGGTVPDVANHQLGGGMIASLGSTFYHLGAFAGNTLRLHSSVDGASWALVSSISHPNFPVASGGVRLIADAYAGVMYAVASVTGTTSRLLVWMTVDNGATWIGPVNLMTTNVNIAAAGGRLFLTPFSSTVERVTVNRLTPAA